MFILKIKFKGDKVYIKVSGGSIFSIPKNGVYELDIYEGMEIEYEEIPHIRMRAYESSAKKSAVNILKRSFVSENMLKEKLAQKGHKKRFINYAIKYCRDYDLIDDKRFTKIAVNSLKLKGKSKRFIIDYLKKAKIKNSLIERASNSISYRSESKALKNAIRKYYKVYENKENKEEYIIRTLMRKGFKYDDIKDLLERYIKNKEK